jgi:hypothetical protein
MDLELEGRVFATPSALTMIVDGVEIHSGQVGSGEPLDTPIALVNLSNVAGNTSLATSVSVTSGVVTIGPVWGLDDQGDPTTSDLRNNILINGSAPEYPATPVVPMPGDNPDVPNWTNWFFEVSAGETITFNIQTPEN